MSNLPLHTIVSFIWNDLKKFYCSILNKINYFKTYYAQTFVDMDFNKGFPTNINLTYPNFVRAQKLDNKNVSFQCRVCYETWYVIENSPKIQRKKYQKTH